MSIAGPLFGSVVDVLRNAATATAIAVDPKSIYQAQMPTGNPQRPWMAIRLPTSPYDSTVWGASSNVRNGIFKVEVGLLADIPQDATNPHPYGDATTPGILTLVDDVLNALENGRATFMAASPKLVDYAVTASAFQKEDALTASATITIIFATRFTAGAR